MREVFEHELEKAKCYAREARRDYAVKVLTPRQLQVLILMGRGKGPTLIGKILGMSHKTASTTRVDMMKRMGLEDNYQVMEYSIRSDMDSKEFMDKHIK